MRPPKRIVVTGAAGWTAEAILTALARHGHRVAGLDLPTSRPAPQASEWIAGSVADLATVQHAARSADALVHLAVATGKDDYQQPAVPFAVNVLGTCNVLEAGRREQVPKIVLISSAAVHLPPVPGRPLTASQWRSSPGSDHLYDLTKRLQEERPWRSLSDRAGPASCRAG
jgi:nucleoside-diphosphate-sugar epimerase